MKKSVKSPFILTLWYKPATTMQGLIAEGKGHGAAVAIAAIFGVLQMGPVFVRAGEGATFGPYALGGAVAGVVGLFFIGLLARNFARWFGGGGALQAVRTALGLGLLPWMLVSAGLFYLLFSGVDAHAVRPYLPFLTVGFLYGYVILLLAMTAALGLSALRTFGTLVITFLVAFSLISLIAQMAVKLLS